MNFQQLEYILAVDRHKNFARAAAASGVTQATLSTMIKKLEKEVGVLIFDRHKQPVITTDQGYRVLEVARHMLAHRTQMLEIGQESNSGLQGEVRLGIIPTVANALLPLVLKPLLTQNPQLHIHISEVTTEEIRRQLISGNLDLGILATPLADDDLEEHILYYEALMVYGIEEENRSFLLPENFNDKEIWLLEDGHCFRNQAMTVCNVQEKPSNENLSFAAGSFDTLLNLTDTFGGYTLIPELYQATLSEERKGKTRHFQRPLPVREISLVYHRPYARLQLMEQFSELIQHTIEPRLSTTGLPAHELSIIGI